jgi:hypothetical protein
MGLSGNRLRIIRNACPRPSTGDRPLPQDEWVYNAANLNDSKVVWARETDVQDNLKLVRHLKDRTEWLVEDDEFPVRVTPFPRE